MPGHSNAMDCWPTEKHIAWHVSRFNCSAQQVRMVSALVSFRKFYLFQFQLSSHSLLHHKLLSKLGPLYDTLIMTTSFAAILVIPRIVRDCVSSWCCSMCAWWIGVDIVVVVVAMISWSPIKDCGALKGTLLLCNSAIDACEVSVQQPSHEGKEVCNVKLRAL